MQAMRLLDYPQNGVADREELATEVEDYKEEVQFLQVAPGEAGEVAILRHLGLEAKAEMCKVLQ